MNHASEGEMNEPTDAEKLEITEWLAEWMGWPHKRFGIADETIVVEIDGVAYDFMPFTDLRDSRLLLEECDRRGLMALVTDNLEIVVRSGDAYADGLTQGLLSTPAQQTLAVWEVVKQNERERK